MNIIPEPLFMRYLPQISVDNNDTDNLVRFWEQANFTRIATYPGLVGSGTLTPECFVGCFQDLAPYVRVQPVLRLLDARAEGSRLHKALFTQLQVFSRCAVQTATDLLLSFISGVLGGANIHTTPQSVPWNALSIGARGVGNEVFIRGIEVAQINQITAMGGSPLEEPACLLAIGIERLVLAGLELNTVMSSYPVATDFSINALLASFDVGVSVAQTIERSFRDLGGPWRGAEQTVAMLGDIQTDVDFAFTTGAISHSYRQHVLRRLRGQYRIVADKVSKKPASPPEKLNPRWTLDAIKRLSANNTPLPCHQTNPACEYQDRFVVNVLSLERIDPNEGESADSIVTDSSRFSYDEFRFVQQCEWERSPDVQCSLAERMTSENGESDFHRVNRLRESSTQMLERLGILDDQSVDLLNRCARLSQLEERSFVSKTMPMAARNNMRAYLRYWNASALDLSLFESRARIKAGNSSLGDIPKEALCFAFYEKVDLLLCRLGLAELHYTSSADPGRIKHHSKQAIVLGALLGIGEVHARTAYNETGQNLGLSERVIDFVFTATYNRFGRRA